MLSIISRFCVTKLCWFGQNMFFFYVMLFKLSVTKDFFFLKLGFLREKHQSTKVKNVFKKNPYRFS